MGCTPNFEKIKQPNLQNTKPMSTIEIEFLSDQLDDASKVKKNINSKSADNVEEL